MISPGDFEKLGALFSEISYDFARVQIDDIDVTVKKNLGRLCRYAGADRAYMYLLKDDGNYVDNLYSWSSIATCSPVLNSLDVNFKQQFPWFDGKLRNGETVLIDSTISLPPGAEKEKTFLEEERISSALLVPFIADGIYRGFLGIDTGNKDQIWSHEDLLLFRLSAEIFINVIIRKEKERKLRITKNLLEERVRELNCHYGISHLAFQDDISVSDLLEGAVDVIINHWKYLNILTVVISYNGTEYSGFSPVGRDAEPFLSQRCAISLYGIKSGWITLCYSRPDEDQENFGDGGELNLLGDIASRLGRALEKKQSEKALKESEALFRNYIESAPDGIFLADREGRFLEMNGAACRITGYSRDELLGMPLSGLTYGEDRKSTMESFLRVQETGRTTNHCRFVKKDGEIRHWIVDAVKLDDNNYLGFNRDITDLKRLEEQLHQMEKMDAIGQLAGGIAHDFNNQIAVIMGYSEMLVERLEDPTLLKFARNILSGAHQSDELTRKLLAFARKGLYENRVVDLHLIIGEAVELLAHSLDRKIEIKIDLEAEKGFTRGDPSQIQNVFINLALNSRDAMAEGGILSFSTSDCTLDEKFCRNYPYGVNPGEFVRISVADTGCGIEPSILPRIFEPFFTTKNVGQGTGMGLASIYGTMTNHKGIIQVESFPGRGTRFDLFFPAEENAVPEEKEIPPSGKSVGTGKIMIIDDEELIRIMSREILENQGYTVVSFESGVEALSSFRENPGDIDLVILDMIMPEMSGKEVFRAIREINDTVPIILSSGFSLGGEVQQLLDQGVAAFIAKPFDLGSFIETVANAIRFQ